jgi:hypothetical protein
MAPAPERSEALLALEREGFSACKLGAQHHVSIDIEDWLDSEQTSLGFDHCVHTAEDQAAGEGIEVRVQGAGPAYARVALEVAQRYQRLWPRQNQHSRSEAFARVLRLHRDLHDLSLPLVRADYEHALDVWQWVLRLAPDANLTLQLAALFHDIERLQSEATKRVEQHAQDYLAFKRAHARRGAHRVAALLAEVAPAQASPVAQLVARHEQPEDDPALRVLNDADALSFFALNSAGFLAYYGPAHTEKKVRYTLARISSEQARARLATLRLEPFIRSTLRQVA